VTLAIIATTKGMAQEMTDLATEAGIKGILNFTPVRVKSPKNAALLNMDITSKLQELNYWREQLSE
jgi:redox-sensing transcriptional repressor